MDYNNMTKEQLIDIIKYMDEKFEDIKKIVKMPIEDIPDDCQKYPNEYKHGLIMADVLFALDFKKFAFIGKDYTEGVWSNENI